MKTILDLILLTIIICFIVDVSGFINDGIKPLIANIINRNSNIKINPESINIPKPFSCSLCMTFWCSLGYLLFTSNFTLPYIALVSFLSLISSNISGFLFCVKDILALIENLIQRLIQKLM